MHFLTVSGELLVLLVTGTGIYIPAELQAPSNQAGNDDPGWYYNDDRYVDVEYAFSITKPEGWRRGNLSHYRVPGELREAWAPSLRANITIFVQESNTHSEPKAVTDALRMRAQWMGATIQEQTDLTVDGAPAVSLVLVGDGTGGALGAGDIRTVARWVAVPRERGVLILLLTCAEAQFPEHKQTFAKALSTLRLVAEPPASQPASRPARSVRRKLTNLDLEYGELDALPEGWSTHTDGYRVVLTDASPHEGRRCAEITSLTGITKASFGNLVQSFDATPYRGKKVRYRAAVRTVPEGPTDRTQMWLRVDRPDKVMGFFDNMDDRPIRDRGWKYYEIVGDVADDAVTINIGLMLISKGTAWLDDVSFAVVIDASAAESVRPLKGQALTNVVAFTRLLGYVRHFHPSDEAARTDWDAFAVAGLRAIEDADDAADLARKLEGLFEPIAPTVRVFPTAEPASIPADLQDKPVEATSLVSWLHQGFGNDSRFAADVYHSERVYQPVKQELTARLRDWADQLFEGPRSFPDPGRPYTADLGGGVSCSVALALYANKSGTLPAVTASKAAGSPALTDFSIRDRAVRLADVALAWNVLQHFYPYFDVSNTDWLAVLPETLQSAATAGDETAFETAMEQMVARLQDGHGMVQGPGPGWWHYRLPLTWDWIEDQLVITQVSQAAADEPLTSIKPGDVVRSINGRPTVDVLAAAENLTSAATPQWRRRGALAKLSCGPRDEEVNLELDRPTDALIRNKVTLHRTLAGQALDVEPRPEKIAELRPGIYYVDISRINDADFSDALPRLERAKAIVFDWRGYPRDIDNPMKFLGHLVTQPGTSPQWHVPIVEQPDHRNLRFNQEQGWPILPQSPHLNARKVFIINSNAISYAESCLGIIEAYKLGELVGEPTAGTNGNINRVKLPGGYSVIFTGMKVLKHDGSRHHGIGICPTVPVSRTLKGVAAGKDELLERALDVACES